MRVSLLLIRIGAVALWLTVSLGGESKLEALSKNLFALFKTGPSLQSTR